MAKNKTKIDKNVIVQMLTTETTTTLPPLVVALVDVVAGQTGKASEGSNHEKVADFSTDFSDFYISIIFPRF